MTKGTFKNPFCSTKLSNTAIPRPINSSNCPSVLLKNVSSLNNPSWRVIPEFVFICPYGFSLCEYGFSGVEEAYGLRPKSSERFWARTESECTFFRLSNLVRRDTRSERKSFTRLGY